MCSELDWVGHPCYRSHVLLPSSVFGSLPRSDLHFSQQHHEAVRLKLAPLGSIEGISVPAASRQGT